jgi:hypothetical protein
MKEILIPMTKGKFNASSLIFFVLNLHIIEYLIKLIEYRIQFIDS